MTEQTTTVVPLDGERLADIDTRAAYLHEYATLTDEPLQADLDQLVGVDVPALLVELRRQNARIAELETDLTRYVGHEPTIADEMAYLGRCLDAVHDLCDRAKKRSHEVVTVGEAEQAADGEWTSPTPRPALPWAHAMDDGDLGGFLDDMVSAAMGRWRSEPEVPDRTVLADIEKVCADWRTPGQGLRSDEPGTGEHR